MEKLLFTGGTGFLGKNVMPLLKTQYDVTTCGITPDDMIKVNLAKEVPALNEHYDVVLHACGKAHMLPKTETEKQEFFDVNYQGTINLCTALEKIGSPKALIFISTVAEQNVTLSILRPSLLAGKDAPGNLGAMVNGIKKGYYMNIAGGKVVKSILMAEDIANILPALVKKGGIYNVCDTRQPSFGELSKSVARQLGKHKPISIPYWMAWCMAKIGDMFGSKAPINSYKLDKMTKSLTFSNKKACKELKWEPLDVLKNLKTEK